MLNYHALFVNLYEKTMYYSSGMNETYCRMLCLCSVMTNKFFIPELCDTVLCRVCFMPTTPFRSSRFCGPGNGHSGAT